MSISEDTCFMQGKACVMFDARDSFISIKTVVFNSLSLCLLRKSFRFIHFFYIWRIFSAILRLFILSNYQPFHTSFEYKQIKLIDYREIVNGFVVVYLPATSQFVTCVLAERTTMKSDKLTLVEFLNSNH